MMRSLLLLLVCLLILPACTPAQVHQTQPLRLRVLSYNIKHCRGEDNTFNYQRLADVIKRVEPDLVALQEVDRKTGRSSGVDQAAKLGELTGMYPIFAEAMPFNGGSYGEALLIDNDLLPQAIPTFVPQQLSAPIGQEPRTVAIGQAYPAGADGPVIAFGGTHLCHQSAQTRLNQVKQINDGPYWSKQPAILAGDFNFTPGSEPYKAMLDAGWVDTAAAFGNPKPTYPSDKPRRRIDYIFVRPADQWRIIDVQVLDEPIASDHAPVLVVLEHIQPAP